MTASRVEVTESQWIGQVVDNEDVRGTIRRYGTPAHSEPHGKGKMILYYVNPNYKPSAEVESEDFAGTITPGGGSRIEHSPMPGALESGTSVNASLKISGAAPTAGLGNQNAYYNPNDLLAHAPIANEGDLDQEILEQQERARDAKAKLTDRDTIAGEGRPKENFGVQGATPFFGATTPGRHPGSVRIEFLDNAQRDAIREGLRSSDPALREPAEEILDSILGTIPQPPAPSDEGLKLTAAEDSALGVVPIELGSLTSTPTEEELRDDSERTEAADNDENATPKDPRAALAAAHPEWDFAFLDGKSKAELEDLADEAEKIGVEVVRVDGAKGELRKQDYIAALRTDKN